MLKVPECRRILASGAKCRALAVKGTPYCFFHQAARDFHQENRKRSKSILVPSLDDRASIQLAIGSVLDAIGSSRMDPLRARAYLYGLQLAMQNIGKAPNFAAPDSVPNPVCSEDGELLAPCEDPSEITAQPESETQLAEWPRDQGKHEPAPSNDGACKSNSECAAEAKDTGFGPHFDTNTNFADSAFEGTIDISASAEEPHHTASPLDRYGNLSPWDLKDSELPEDELHKRKVMERIVKNTVRDILAVTPFHSPSDRQKLHRQLHAEYMTEYLGPKPEPLQCAVASRYRVHLLA